MCVYIYIYIYIYIYRVLRWSLLASITQYSDPSAGWGTGESEFNSRVGQRVVSSPRPALGPHTPSCSIYRRTGGKATGARNGCLVSVADIKNTWSFTSAPHFIFMVWFWIRVTTLLYTRLTLSQTCLNLNLQNDPIFWEYRRYCEADFSFLKVVKCRSVAYWWGL